VSDAPVIEIRRSRKRFISRSIETYAPFVGVSIIATIAFGDIRGRIIAIVAVLLLGLGLSIALQRRARVFITPDRFGRRGWLGTWWMRRADLERALFVEALTGRDGRRARELFLFDPTGARVAHLSGRVWGNKNVSRIAQTLAVPMTTIGRVVSAKELATIEPRSLRFFERHPSVAIFGVGIVVLSLVFAVTALLSPN